MALSFSSKVTVRPDILISNLRGESVILNLYNERYYGLGNVGTRFLSALTESDSIEDAYKKLTEEYDVEGEVLRRDLINLLEELLQQGLIECLP